ncbi:hypothetical protein BHE74_00054193 [Ensete ventricosum]|nr:hypothetical protein BHE74_00054193 [Ensete ventricosum]
MAQWPSTSIVDESTKAVRRRGGQPPCRAGHPRPGHGQGPLQGGGGLRLEQARKGGQRRPQGVAPAGRSVARRGSSRPCAQSTVGSPQGRQLPVGTTTCSVAPARGCRQQGGDASRRGGRPLAGRLPAGKGSRSLRWGNDDGDDAEGERGVRASFGKKIILPL